MEKGQERKVLLKLTDVQGLAHRLNLKQGLFFYSPRARNGFYIFKKLKEVKEEEEKETMEEKERKEICDR